jgi:hypothetical protein
MSEEKNTLLDIPKNLNAKNFKVKGWKEEKFDLVIKYLETERSKEKVYSSGDPFEMNIELCAENEYKKRSESIGHIIEKLTKAGFQVQVVTKPISYGDGDNDPYKKDCFLRITKEES